MTNADNLKAMLSGDDFDEYDIETETVTETPDFKEDHEGFVGFMAEIATKPETPEVSADIELDMGVVVFTKCESCKKPFEEPIMILAQNVSVEKSWNLLCDDCAE